jgi:hypothetical protein
MNIQTVVCRLPILAIAGMALAMTGGGVIGVAAAQDDSAVLAEGIIGGGAAVGSGLELPDDIAEAAQPRYTIEERRIGSRLERVTVHRNNGLDEVYENREVDSMWASEEKELGEVPNVRRWTIGSW